jgi:hypothetical protein
MAHRVGARSVVFHILALLVLGAVLSPQAALASSYADESTLPDLASFAASVVDGDGKALRGVYAEERFALPVIQQPYSSFVSQDPGTLTEFGPAQRYGVIGFLAHNYLAGQQFFGLRLGDEISVIYGDGRTEAYRVTHVYRYQAVEPQSAYSDFIDLYTGSRTDAAGLFRRVYMGDKHVTFQTCIAKGGQLSWGRLFVIAEPWASPSDEAAGIAPRSHQSAPVWARNYRTGRISPGDPQELSLGS